jgi:hypothetical protein
MLTINALAFVLLAVLIDALEPKQVALQANAKSVNSFQNNNGGPLKKALFKRTGKHQLVNNAGLTSNGNSIQSALTVCYNGGTLLKNIGICSCTEHYMGKFCQTPYCPHGHVNKCNTCTCDDGYSGQFCTYFHCYNGGTPLENIGLCSCTEHYMGNFCQTPYCPHGHVNKDNTCTCDDGYSGQFCTDFHCYNSGTPLENIGLCSCTEHYMGNFCQTPYCPHGHVNNDNTCTCDDGYSGQFCTEFHCYNGGTLLKNIGICSCTEHYMGNFCQTPYP